MKLDLTALDKALNRLNDAVDSVTDQSFMAGLSESQANTLKAGLIQTFEFSYEVCWKMIKRQLILLEDEATINQLNRKDLFRMAAQKNLIDDPCDWFKYHQARNETSHTYNQIKADAVIKIALSMPSSVSYLFKQLQQIKQ